MPPKMPPSNTLHLKAQDQLFYTQMFPKEHQEWLVIGLQRLAEKDGLWKWPDKIDEGNRRMVDMLKDKFGITYTIFEVNKVVYKMFERHLVFQKMLKVPGLRYCMYANKFTGDYQVWEELVKEDNRCLWYLHVGDPLWCDLGVLFEGEAFGYVADTENMNETEELEHADDDSVQIISSYDLDKQALPVVQVYGSPRPPPGNINLVESPILSVSPIGVLPNRFASPSTSSPGFSYISEKDFDRVAIKSGNKKSHKKKLVWDYNGSLSESSGSSPVEKPQKKC